jgi:hypothetical protein
MMGCSMLKRSQIAVLSAKKPPFKTAPKEIIKKAVIGHQPAFFGLLTSMTSLPA